LKIIRPNSSEPIPLPQSPPQLGSMMRRLTVLLALAALLAVVAWLRI
jgi:hypothetical protein